MLRNSFILVIICITISWASSQTKNLSSFTSISTSGSVQVELVKSDVTKAEYTILKGKTEDLDIHVANDELVVKIKNKMKFSGSNTKAKVTVYYTTLSSIDCSAGSSVSTSQHINTTNMKVESSSGAKCQLLVKCTDLTLDSSSGSSISINGSAHTANYDASSGANINASSLTADNAVADASSGASIKLYALKKLSADASSGGSIKYKGKPENVNVESGTSGSISSF
jgi:hypothetical protein